MGWYGTGPAVFRWQLPATTAGRGFEEKFEDCTSIRSEFEQRFLDADCQFGQTQSAVSG